MTVQEMREEALARARGGLSTRNYGVILDGFTSRGIPEARIVKLCAKFPKRWRAVYQEPSRSGEEHAPRLIALGDDDSPEAERYVRGVLAQSVSHGEPREGHRVELAGVEPCFSGDPRGCTVKLRVPSCRNNSFGGGGYICVPSREY